MQTTLRQELKEETRLRLINAGINIILNEGYDAFNTSAISKAAGIAQPGFYVHFKNVVELLREIIQRYKTDHTEPKNKMMIALARDERTDIENLIRAYIAEELETVIKAPVIFHIGANYHRFKKSELQTVIAEEYAYKLAQFAAFVKAFLEGRGLKHKPETIKMAADMIMSGNDAVVLGVIEGRFKTKTVAIDLMLNNTLQNMQFLLNYSHPNSTQTKNNK